MENNLLKEEIKIETVELPLTFILDDKGVKDIERQVAELQKQLKGVNKIIDSLSPEYVALLYKNDEEKLGEIKSKLDEKMHTKTLIESDIRSLIKFKDGFKKKLANKSKIIEEEKSRKVDEEIKSKFKEELLLNTEALAEIFLDEKKRDRTMTCSRFLAKIKRMVKDGNNKGSN